MRALLIDDDQELAEALKLVLNTYSIELDSSPSPEEGIALLSSNNYDVLLLDIMLPGINGFECCRYIRQQLNKSQADIPIIMVSARTDLVDKVAGFETGADDYVSKPFEPRELVARIYALLRRTRSVFLNKEHEYSIADHAEKILSFTLQNDTLSIDHIAVRVVVNNVDLELTSFEFDILHALIQKRGEVVSKDELLDLVGNSNSFYTDSLVSLIYRLRNKIRQVGAEEDFIRTVRNRGYSFLGTDNIKTR